MTSLRRLVRTHPAWTGGLIAAALLLKLLMPTGWMLSVEHNRWSVVPCAGIMPVEPEPATASMHAMTTDHGVGQRHDRDGHGGRAEQPCAFAGLSLQGLASADPVLLAGLILFILVTAFRPQPRPEPHRIFWIKPPLRAPPAVPLTA